MRNTQPSLFNNLQTSSEKREQKRRVVHGGSETQGKRKSKRPLCTKQWIHLVLKSDRAKGKLSMLSQNNAKWIDQLLRAKAKKFGVELKDFVNMGNHIHFKLRILNRRSFQSFLRSITNLIARYVTGARKGKRFGKFWEGLAYTRVVTSYFELTQLAEYFTANRIQKTHGYKAREEYLEVANRRVQSLKVRT